MCEDTIVEGLLYDLLKSIEKELGIDGSYKEVADRKDDILRSVRHLTKRAVDGAVPFCQCANPVFELFEKCTVCEKPPRN